MQKSRGSVVHIGGIILVTIIAVTEVWSLRLTISPERGHLNMAGDNMTVLCLADQPIRRCQFNFFTNEERGDGPLLDLSLGRQSPMDPTRLSDAVQSYSYRGSGLDNGQCGVVLSLVGWKRYMLGCRVQGAQGGWRYAITSFTADQSSSIPVSVSTKEAVVLPGRELSLLCKAKGPLEWCRFDLPGKHIFLDQGAQSEESTDQHRYHGAGLPSGECGVTVPAVTEESNGFFFCGIVTKPGSWERTGIPVIVARPPNAPILEVISTDFSEGALLEAICTVRGGRPVSNLTWYLGDEILRQDDEDDVPDDIWRWPTSYQTITQKVTRRLLAGDNGRTLRCVVTHVALPQPLSATRVINFSLCPPVVSKTVAISCTLADEYADCLKMHQIGTVARLACKPGHTLASSVGYRKVTCRRGGKWDRPVFTCAPDCGRRITNTGAQLSANGKDGAVGEFPWHVSIYEAMGASGSLSQICGGSLITPNMVVSAAHCFWDPQTSKKRSASDYKVAAGKHLRAWEDPDPMVEKRNVSEIVLPVLFRGRRTRFASDIALLRLSVSLEITARVNLICVDWDNEFESRQLRAGSVGIVTGWGYTEDGILSSILKYVELPYVPPEKCLDSLPEFSQPLYTHDKFCAGFINKSTSVCGGDSGGGLVFRHPGSDKHYLRGIVSIAFTPPTNNAVCNAEHYTGFTLFSKFITWVQDNV